LKFFLFLILACTVCNHSAVFAQTHDDPVHPGKHWRALLMAKDFAALETAIKTLHGESLHPGAKSRELRRALGYLVHAGATDARLFDEFAKASPNTYGVMTRGYFTVNQGWKARGKEFANKTSEEQFARMQQHMSSAISDFEIALQGLQHQCDPCYAGLINIGMALGRVELKAQAINASVRYDGGGFDAPLAYMSSLDVRWGGSKEKMQRYVDEFASQFPNSFTSNALKAAFLIAQAEDYIYAGQNDRARFLADQAIKIDPGSANAWGTLTTIALNNNQYEWVIETSTRALVIDPDMTYTRNARAHAYLNGKSPLSAVPDLEYAVIQGDEWALQVLLPIIAAGKYGFVPDRQRAKVICQSAIDALMASGFTCMGGLYYFGFDGSPNHVEARKWFVEGANRGNPSAMVDVGVMLWRGQGGDSQPSEAVKYWRMGKAAGEPRAEQQLRSNLSQLEYWHKVTMPEIWYEITGYVNVFTMDWQERLRALLYLLTGRSFVSLRV
jgi:tetratricopeptide (TPR) repeat protein